LSTGARTQMPELGETACFSVFNTRQHWMPSLPPAPPWTHKSDEPSDRVPSIEGVNS
jgi:hypothetical protein